MRARGLGFISRLGMGLAAVPLAAGVLAAASGAAGAHAIVIASVPGDDAKVAGPMVPVELRFNSRIDQERSRLSLMLPDHSLHPVALAPDKRPDHLSATLRDLAPGSYHLRWQVLAVDGHLTRGDIPFTVTAP